YARFFAILASSPLLARAEWPMDELRPPWPSAPRSRSAGHASELLRSRRLCALVRGATSHRTGMGARGVGAADCRQLSRKREAFTLRGHRDDEALAALRRCLGMDPEPLCPLSRLSPAARFARRIQREVHVQ